MTPVRAILALALAAAWVAAEPRLAGPVGACDQTPDLLFAIAATLGAAPSRSGRGAAPAWVLLGALRDS